MTQNPVLAFGRWVAETPSDWPEDALTWAWLETIDIVSVMIPGAVEPAALNAFATVRDWGAGSCAAVGQSARLAAPWAALVNGTAGHALDFDDNFDPPKAHATTVLFPAILALGEQEGASGADCLDAYVVGLQIMGRVGQGLNPPHRDRGWHATATVGAIGAAAACARLLKLDAEKAAYALSIATSMAAGFMSQFGTMTKPLHAGLAAKAGIMAASFARAGMDAGLSTFEGRTGLTKLMVGPDYEDLRDAMVENQHGQTLRYNLDSIGDPLLITEHKFRVKRFPTCGVAHRAMDGLLDLMAEHGFAGGDVAAVKVRLPQLHQNNLMHHDPRTGLEGKFSQEYALATLLHQGTCTLEDFTDEAVMRPDVRAFYDIITLEAVDKYEWEFPTEIHITLKDGRALNTAVGLPRGSKAAPFTEQEYWQKFEACCKGHLSPADTHALRDVLDGFADLPTLAPLSTLLARPFASNPESV